MCCQAGLPWYPRSSVFTFYHGNDHWFAAVNPHVPTPPLAHPVWYEEYHQYPFCSTCWRLSLKLHFSPLAAAQAVAVREALMNSSEMKGYGCLAAHKCPAVAHCIQSAVPTDCSAQCPDRCCVLCP